MRFLISYTWIFFLFLNTCYAVASAPEKAFEKKGNIYVKFNDGTTKQLTFEGIDKSPVLSNNKKFVICLRSKRSKLSRNDAAAGKRIPVDIIYIDLLSFQERILLKGNKNINEQADIDYGNTDRYPLKSLCSIEHPILSPDDKRVYFQTEAWEVCPAIHYYIFETDRIIFFHSGWLLDIDEKGNIIATITTTDKEGYMRDWLLDNNGQKIKPLSEKQ
jgi:hypothetical protein